MPLIAPEVLHVFEAGVKRAEVQFLGGDEGVLRYRVVYIRGSENGTAPDYFAHEERAIEVARAWAYHD